MNRHRLHELIERYLSSPLGQESQYKLAMDIQHHIKIYGRDCFIISLEEQLSEFLLNKYNDEDKFREFVKSIDKSIIRSKDEPTEKNRAL